MKLFEKQREEYNLYLETAINSKQVELECIFGMIQSKNPINKKIFLQLMDRCKENYNVMEESTSLDIRNEFRNNLSNIRCTINGLESIKKYCNEESIENINNEDVSFMIKQYYKDKSVPDRKYISLKDNNYNVRLNIKSEKLLVNDNRFVIKFLDDFNNKRKHFRYKKRMSFLTKDKLFRIDLTVVKSTRWMGSKYDFQKTFKGANILRQREEYELEIEYVGWKKEVGDDEIDRLYNHLNQFYIAGPGKEVLGNIYDPLNIGINIYDIDQEKYIPEQQMDGGGPFGWHPSTKPFTFDNEDERYTDNTIVEESEKVKYYNHLIGKYVKIKDSYFIEINEDKKLQLSLKQYYERGINILLVKDIYEYSNGKIETIIDFVESMGDYNELRVPIEYIYKVQTFEPDNYGDEETEYFDTNLEGTVPGEKNKEKAMKDIIEKVSIILENHVIDLSKVIYQTDNIISYELKENVLNKYKEFTEQSTKPYHFTFMAPQPVTLTLDHLKINNLKIN